MEFLTDEDFDNRIIRGVLRKMPEIDIVRVQDTEAFQQSDDVVFAHAIETDRILLSMDMNTMPLQVRHYAENGVEFPGLILVSQSLPIGIAVDEILLAAGAGQDDDFRNVATYLPL